MGELEIFANRLKQLRVSLNMTQKEFSEYVGIKQQTLSGYERGIMKPPLDITKTIAEKCHVSIDWLCGLTDRPNNENTVETYADVVNLILVLLKNKNLQTKLFAFQNEGVAFWGFLDATLHKFFIDWIKIKKLYDEKVIDENMYHPWIAGKLTELNVPIKKSSARYLNHLIEQLACEIDGCTDDKDE